jgi:hypothetical protein
MTLHYICNSLTPSTLDGYLKLQPKLKAAYVHVFVRASACNSCGAHAADKTVSHWQLTIPIIWLRKLVPEIYETIDMKKNDMLYKVRYARKIYDRSNNV